MDVLVKPLSDGSFAVTVVNLGEKNCQEEISLSVKELLRAVETKAVRPEAFYNCEAYERTELWTGETKRIGNEFAIPELNPHDQITFRIRPAE